MATTGLDAAQASNEAPHVLATSAPTPPSPEQLAAVDLGSNSFHYVIAALVDGEPEPIDRQREPVRLAAGLSRKSGRLSDEAQTRALACLARFRQRLEHLPADQVRVVGTSTLRRARRANEFIVRAEAVLGRPIEVISGAEEARLVYLGVAHSLPDAAGLRCVVDIGGGSTEIVIGRGFEVQELASLAMGCVEYTRRFFRKRRATGKSFDKAALEAARQLRPTARRLLDAGWEQAVGSSGTIKAVAQVLRAHGRGEHGITGEDVTWLRRELLRAGERPDTRIAGLKSDRAPVFAAGLAILTALFDRLPLEPLTPARGALREGVLYDLLGRIRHEDVRERTILRFQERYRVDRAQAERVEHVAAALLLHAPRSWGLCSVEDGRLLAWAARLHEVGLSVSLDAYHRHSAYLLAHAYMPGFARNEQRRLALIVGAQRRTLRRSEFERLDPTLGERTLRQALLLRWAVALCRPRGPRTPPPVRIHEQGETLALHFPEGWLDEHPLTRLDLEAERKFLRRAGVRLLLAP